MPFIKFKKSNNYHLIHLNQPLYHYSLKCYYHRHYNYVCINIFNKKIIATIIVITIIVIIKYDLII